jgi:hypothetical protein
LGIVSAARGTCRLALAGLGVELLTRCAFWSLALAVYAFEARPALGIGCATRACSHRLAFARLCVEFLTRGTSRKGMNTFPIYAFRAEPARSVFGAGRDRIALARYRVQPEAGFAIHLDSDALSVDQLLTGSTLHRHALTGGPVELLAYRALFDLAGAFYASSASPTLRVGCAGTGDGLALAGFRIQLLT